MPEHNFPAFRAAADRLRRLGFDVFNPADTGLEDIRECLGADLAFIAAHAQGIALLPGSETSLGARAEIALANAIGIPVRSVETWIYPKRLIGLSGYARAGKDAVGQILGSREFVTCSFAAALKDAALVLNPRIATDHGHYTQDLATIVENVGWDIAKEHFPDVRPFLQRLGADVARELLGANVWVDIAFRDMPTGDHVAFTDVRFPNEAQAIKDRGGQVWRVTRPGCEPANAHPSETALDGWKFDRNILNDGSLEQLRVRVMDALKEAP
jgi:hypothetical protein